MSKTKTSTDTPQLTESAEELDAPRDRGGRFALLLWGGAGVALVLAGLLPFADRLSWRLVQFGRLLDTLGLQPGVLFLAGLTFVALALVVHAVRHSATTVKSATERIAFLSDELIAQMALVRGGQNGGLQQLDELRQSLSRVGAEVAGLANRENEASSDALFRLAASVDQLNARLDDRFNVMTERVEDRLGELDQHVKQMSPEQRTAHQSTVTAPTAAPAVAQAPFQPDPAELAAEPEPENPFESIDLDHQPAMEFLESMEEQVEGRPYRESSISLRLDGPDMGGPFSIEDADPDVFGEDLPPSIGDGRRSA